MPSLQLSDIQFSFGERPLLKGASLFVDGKTRAALVGGNGEGKSTLLRLASGEIQPDGGRITASKGLVLRLLPQSGAVLGDRTVYEEIETAFSRFRELEEEKALLEARFHASPDDASLAARIGQIQDRLDLGPWFTRQATIFRIADGLGFRREDMGRRCAEFSGGFRMRIALARTLAGDPDILLLDEPTNYLDIEARVWLKSFIRQFDGGLVLVCHDRRFLDETVDEVYELERGVLTRYKGNYTSYERKRLEEIRTLEALARKRQLEIEKNEAFIERFRYKATKSRQAQSRVKLLEKLKPIEVPSHLRRLSFSFPEPPHSPNDVLAVENLHKSYGSNVIFDRFSLMVSKGDRLAVTGHNGAGKSTLLRIMAGEDSLYSGTVRLGPKVSIGYFRQDTEEALDPDKTVEEEAAASAPTGSLPALRSLLGSFLFSGDDVQKKVHMLSGGERSRLALLKILLRPVSLLILDEPANNLDINAQDMLVEALSGYKGTLVFVSHDSDFIARLATRILYLSEDKPELYSGDYDYFVWKLEQKKAFVPVSASRKSEALAPGADALAHFESKKLRNRRQKLEREASGLLAETQALKERIEEKNALAALPEYYTKPERMAPLFKEKKALEALLQEKEDLWLETSLALEELETYGE